MRYGRRTCKGLHDDEYDDEHDDGEDYDFDDEHDEHARTAVTHLQLRIIRHGLIRLKFWQEMERPSQDTSALAFDSFDR